MADDDNMLQYKPGTILLLETGEYSDFGYIAQLVTLQHLDMRNAVEIYTEDYRVKNPDWDSYLSYDGPEPDGFVAWLCTTQQCAQLECQTLHIGSYGKLEL